MVPNYDVFDVFGKKKKEEGRLGKSGCILFHSSLFEATNIDLQVLLAKILGLVLIMYGLYVSGTRKYRTIDIGGKTK